MNLAVSKAQPLNALSWHILLESQTDGQIAAWIAEWPDCRVVAASKEAAIEALEPLLNQRMANLEVMEFSFPTTVNESSEPHPLDNFPFIDKNDPEFIEFMAELRASRELDDDNPAYTINW
jgi:hypothetical protein